MIEIVAYQCDYCSRRYFSKGGVKVHEKACWYNPCNGRCGGCKYHDGEGSCCFNGRDVHVYASETCENFEPYDENE